MEYNLAIWTQNMLNLLHRCLIKDKLNFPFGLNHEDLRKRLGAGS